MKFDILHKNICFHGRAPQGARGLKSTGTRVKSEDGKSRPARGAWVEMAIMVVKS